MSEIFTLTCILQSATGGIMAIPMRHYDDEKVATDAKIEHEAGVKDLIEGAKIVVNTDAGPRILMPLAQFLGQLGISAVGHQVAKGAVHGAVVLQPRSPIILPGH